MRGEEPGEGGKSDKVLEEESLKAIGKTVDPGVKGGGGGGGRGEGGGRGGGGREGEVRGGGGGNVVLCSVKF